MTTNGRNLAATMKTFGLGALIVCFVTAVACTTYDRMEAHRSEASAGVVDGGMESSRQESIAFRTPLRASAPAWERPVKGLPRHKASDYYVDLLWTNSTDRPGNFNLRFDDYTYPVYSTAEATGYFPVRTRWDSDIDGQAVPWNPKWRPAPGRDAQIIVIDEKTGREWNFFQVSFRNDTVHATNASLVPGDYRRRTARTGAHPPSRGAGIPYLAMLVRPEQVEAGLISHALSMPIKSPSGQYYVSPATKLEFATGKVGVPQGMRFAIDVSDEEIEAWLDGLEPLEPRARRAARTVAVALRDYGWFITDTSGAAGFQFEANVSAAEKWKRLGFHASSPIGAVKLRDLVDGLVTKDRLYALVPSMEYGL